MNTDTICALATATGGAICIVRVSGHNAIPIADSLFRPATNNAKSLADAKANTLHYGSIINTEGEVVDDVIVSVFRHPHSYTGEDSVEISCHGSRYITNTIIQLLIEHGCRQANPGEYTQRAFINGKMDLSQAEAVADLISSTNKATHSMAIAQLRGNFSSLLAQLRDKLLHITTLLELELDFSEEDVTFASREEIISLVNDIRIHISSLAASFKTGNAIKHGVPVAIIGKTNVGKSTLLNHLVGEERAIVSNIHGTTRDVIEDAVDIRGVTFRFIDTAGIRHTDDEVEKIGIDLAYRKIEEASVVLWLSDEKPDELSVADMLERCRNKKLLSVCTKCDDGQSRFDLSLYGIPTISISAANEIGLDTLRDKIFELSDIPEIHANDVIVTSARHYQSLIHALDCIDRIEQGLSLGLSGDLLSEDLRLCITHLSDIVGGTITTDEVLSNLFSHFCIGK